MRTLVRALGLGAAFGLAAATVELWLGLVPVVQWRFGPGPRALIEMAALDIALSMALALVAAPLLRLRRGTLLHVTALALAWAALAKWVEIESAFLSRLQFLPPALGALGLGVALRLGRRRRSVPLVLGLLLFASGVAAPGVYLRLSTPKASAPLALPPAPANAPDIVMVVLDTVRAQSLSTYGYGRATSPRLEELSRDGALFLDATAPSTWSLASHASLFTGRYPSANGAHIESRFLDDRFPTLAEVLARRGYETRCFTANAWISDGLGLTRGFAWQDASWKSREMGQMFHFVHRLLARFGVEAEDKGGQAVATHFATWWRERPADARPAFVFLNFLEAHFPYHQLPDAFLGRFTTRSRSELREISLALLGAQFGGELEDPESLRQPARDMYDAGVLYTDFLLGQVVDALRERGTLERAILVVLGDHGEMLGEHAEFFGHGPSLYQPLIRVPLLVRYPPRVGRGVRVEQPVSTVGAFATILDLAGIEPPPTLQVGSLVPVIDGAGGGGPILSERFKVNAMVDVDRRSGDPLMRPDWRYRAYRRGRWKLVETSRGATFLFDVVGEPSESRDLAAEHPAELARLQSSLAAVRATLRLPALDAAGEAGVSPELDPTTRRRLRELGYAE